MSEARAEPIRAIDRVHPQRDRLKSALAAYEVAVVRDAPGWASGAAVPLARLREAFREHVEFTEGPGGLFEEMLDDRAIDAASEIDHLRRDHVTIGVAIDRAAAAITTPPSDEHHRREILTQVARMVGQHRRRGAQLLYDVYSVDTPGGD